MNITFYKISCLDKTVSNIYIGSTNNFHKRCIDHKSSCNNQKRKEYNLKLYTFIRKNGGFNNWKLTIISEQSNISKKASQILEQEFIVKEEPLFLLNSYRAHQTSEEHAEQLKLNNAKINAKHSVKQWHCVCCDKTMGNTGKYYHRKTPIHIENDLKLKRI